VSDDETQVSGNGGKGGGSGDEGGGPNGGSRGPRGRRGGDAVGLGLVLFVLGICVGFPLAVIGSEFLTENAGLIITFVLIFVAFVGMLGMLLLLFRRRILGYLFGISVTTLDQFARPLTKTTRHIAERQPSEAADAAEELVKLILARWAWVSSRRWLIASLTGLLAALAALAGTALLFRQNELIASQLVRLDQQNALLVRQNELGASQVTGLGQQNDLLRTQIELGEAQRSAGILPSLLDIGSDLAEEVARQQADDKETPVVFLRDLSSGLRARMVAATQAARPYRYLQGGSVDARDTDALNGLALARRPEILADAQRKALKGQSYETELIDRPVSPERGMVIAMLFETGIYETELLSFRGADFSFAQVSVPVVNLMSFTFARLRFADFSRLQLNSVRFGAAELEHARFRNATLNACDFAGIPHDQVKEPYRGDPSVPVMETNMAGADFAGSMVIRTTFARVNGLAIDFDGAALIEPDFRDASIAGSTFRNALLLRPNFSGANLKAVDFDGAIVFAEDFLARVSGAAVPETFRADRFTLERIDLAEIGSHPLGVSFSVATEGMEIGEAAYRIKRVGEFR